MTKAEISEFHASSLGYLWSVKYLPGASVCKASLCTTAPQWLVQVIAVPLIALLEVHFAN
jgi:hypothetical protein